MWQAWLKMFQRHKIEPGGVHGRGASEWRWQLRSRHPSFDSDTFSFSWQECYSFGQECHSHSWQECHLTYDFLLLGLLPRHERYSAAHGSLQDFVNALATYLGGLPGDHCSRKECFEHLWREQQQQQQQSSSSTGAAAHPLQHSSRQEAFWAWFDNQCQAWVNAGRPGLPAAQGKGYSSTGHSPSSSMASSQAWSAAGKGGSQREG